MRSFFADPALFEELTRTVCPAILKGHSRRSPVRVWVAGCSEGTDLYSLTIALIENHQSARKDVDIQMFGTDTDSEALRRARSAIYTADEIAGISKARLKRFFVRENGSFRVAQAVRDLCTLGQHDWIHELPFLNMDLVFCPRDLEQISPSQRQPALAKLGLALAPSGVLVLGGWPAVEPTPEWAEVVNREHGILRRKADLTAHALVFAQGLALAPLPRPHQPDTRKAASGRRSGSFAPQVKRGLAATREELEKTVEKLQIANEELHTTNEELRATWAALNETNEELASKNTELSCVRDDLTNILASLRVPVIVLDAELRVRRFTPAASFVVPLIDLDVGRPLLDLQPRVFVPELADILNSVIDSGIAVDKEVQDTEGRSYLMHVRPYIEGSGRNNGVLLHVFDLSDVKRRLAFEATGDSLLLTDAEKAVLIDLNPAAERLFGYSRADTIGRRLEEIEPLRRIPDIHVLLQQIRLHRRVPMIALSVPTPHGSEIHLEINANGFREDDRLLVQFNIRDVTERKEFERKLQDTQKLESLGLLAGGIAHDFNNLLTGILGNAGLLARSPGLDRDARERVDGVMQSAERAAFLTRQMLAYAGKGHAVTEPVDLGKLMRETAALLRTSFSKNATVELDLAPDLPTVEADPGQMQQLLMNLMINAAEAIGDRPGTVRVRAGVAQLSESPKRLGEGLLPAGSYVWIDVIDDGTGMDSATLARIFDPFFTTKFAGRGLGLAAVRGIITAHAGDLRVQSTPAKGSTFRVLLPAGRAAAVADVPQLPWALPRDVTVLVIDDEEPVREVASAILERYGMRVLAADSGSAGVELLRRHRGEVSLVILDFLMPRMSGEETLPLLREVRPDVPVLLSSGYDESEATERFSGEKPSGFIQKPYNVDRLLEGVSSALSRHD